MKDAEKGRYLAGQVKGFFAGRGEAVVGNDLVNEAIRLFPL